MTTIKLSNGVEMPIFGLGTLQASEEECIKAIHAALDAGYRLIDTAWIYKNENEVGRALEEYFKTGKLSRKDVFITTKLWCNNNRPDDVEKTLRSQLKALRTDYVDLYLIHQPVAYKEDMSGPDPGIRPEHTWKAMEHIYKKGLAKSIGVSNFGEDQIEKILERAEVPIHNLQVEVHLFFQQEKLVEFCRKKNIAVTAYAPIGSPGMLTELWPDLDQKALDAANPLKNSLVLNLAKKYHKSPAQILLRHHIQRNIGVVPKSSNPQRIKENIDIFDFSLSDEDLAELAKLNKNQRLYVQPIFIGHPDDPWKNERK